MTWLRPSPSFFLSSPMSSLVGIPKEPGENWKNFFVRLACYRLVILHNDDTSPMNVVIERLQNHLLISSEKARSLMLAAHTTQRIGIFHGFVILLSHNTTGPELTFSTLSLPSASASASASPSLLGPRQPAWRLNERFVEARLLSMNLCKSLFQENLFLSPPLSLG